MLADLQIYFGVALAGLVSFLSPCVLPLVPPYLSYLGGTTIDEMSGEGRHSRARLEAGDHRRAAVRARLYDGVRRPRRRCLARRAAHPDLQARAGDRLRPHHHPVRAALPRHLPHPLLYKEARYHGQHHHGVSYIGSYVIGLAFAFGWTPCIGPILATVLALAANEGSLVTGVKLLTVYSLGLGIPFILAAVAMRPFLGFMQRFRRHLDKVEKAMGAFLVLTGLLFFTGSINWFGSWLLDNVPGPEPDRADGDAEGSRHRDPAARAAGAMTGR